MRGARVASYVVLPTICESSSVASRVSRSYVALAEAEVVRLPYDRQNAQLRIALTVGLSEQRRETSAASLRKQALLHEAAVAVFHVATQLRRFFRDFRWHQRHHAVVHVS